MSTEEPTPNNTTPSTTPKHTRKTGFFTKIAKSVSSISNKLMSDDDMVSSSVSAEGRGTLRKTRTAHRTGSRKNKSLGLEELEREELERRLQLTAALSSSERAFLPFNVRTRLLESATLPKCPLMEQTFGVALFADISGFTALGKLLRSQFPSLEAAAKLANRIGSVLKTLTTVCVQEFGGDVVKFAGDALLCVFPYGENMDTQEVALQRAKACAVRMLKQVKLVDPQLDLHGGLAFGKVLNLHLGDAKREALWYLVTGDAVVRAVNLVNAAPRGKIFVDLGGDDNVDTLTVDSVIDFAPALAAAAVAPTEAEITPKGRAYIPQGLRNILMNDRTESGEMRSRVAILFATLPGLSMSPEEMLTNTLSEDRTKLLNTTFSHISQIVRETGGEFRDLLFDDKGCVFIAVFGAYAEVEMAELKALKSAKRMNEELEVEELKIGLSVGTCFVGLVGNETRLDMIVMGNEVNMASRYMAKANEGTILCSEQIMRATKDLFQFEPIKIDLKKVSPAATAAAEQPASLQHTNSMKNTSSFRRFELYDNDLLGESSSVSPVEAAAPQQLQRSASVIADPNGLVTAYRPIRETAKRGSFYAMYRYVGVIPDAFFQGRKDELKRLQAHIQRGIASKTFSVGFLSGPRGYGKSWLVRELRRRMSDNYSFALSVAFELDVNTPLYAIRQLIETLFEVFDGMPKKKASTLHSQWQSAGIKVDSATIDTLLPYVAKLLPEKSASAAATAAASSNTGWIKSIRIGAGSKLSRNLGAGGGSFTSLERSWMESPELADLANAVVQQQQPRLKRHGSSNNNAAPIAVQEEFVGSARHISTAATTRQQKSDSLSDQQPSFVAKARAVSLVEETIEEEVIVPTELRLGSSGAAVAPSEHVKLVELTAQDSEAALQGANAQAASRRRLFSSFRAGSVVTRARAASMLPTGNSSSSLLATPPPALPEPKPKKKFQSEKELVKGKVELDALVKFVAALIDFAAKEATKMGKKGLVLVIEDIQWLDAVSLQVLCEMVSRDLFPGNVYLLLSMRSNTDAKRMEEFTLGGKRTDVRSLLETELRDSCAELKTFAVFEVDVLTRLETDQLVSKLLTKNQGDTVSDEVKDDVFGSTGGMPNAVADVIDLIRANNGAAVYLDPNTNQWRWKNSTSSATGKEQRGKAVLTVARQAYLSRIDHLNLETREFLKIAACLADDMKQRFKLQDLVRVLKWDADTRSSNQQVPSVDYVSLRLESAVEAGLLKNRTGLFNVTEEWSFASSVICETVLELVPADRLREVKEMILPSSSQDASLLPSPPQAVVGST